MQAYPLIYSRTKNDDFVPDFLVRPEDLDWQTALKYVENAMANLDILKTIRYSVFSVGNYCICGGISCVTKYLVEELKKSNNTFDFQAVSEYLRDCKGRSIACFIGFAIPKSPKSEVQSGSIPDIPLSKNWSVYLEYLKHQWDNPKTYSETLNSSQIKDYLDEKIYSSSCDSCEQKFESIQEKKVVRNQKENLQEILDYFFDQILNKGSQDSFISGICYRDEWDALNFNHASVSEGFYNTLKSIPKTTAIQEDSFDREEETSVNQPSVPLSNDRQKAQKKTNLKSMWIIAVAVLVVVIVIIAMVLKSKGEAAKVAIDTLNNLQM